MIKVGLAGDDAPRGVFANIIGSLRMPAVMTGMNTIDSCKS
jgi:hypothetical protein